MLVASTRETWPRVGLGRWRVRAKRSCSEGEAEGHLLAREAMALTWEKRRSLEGCAKEGRDPMIARVPCGGDRGEKWPELGGWPPGPSPADRHRREM